MAKPGRRPPHALAAARQSGDRAGEAHIARLLDLVHGRLSRCDDAQRYLQEALAIFGDLGDHTGQAIAHSNLGMVCGRQQRYQAAVDHTRRALDLYRATGHRIAEGAR